MIDLEIVNRLKRGTCAILRMPVPHDVALPDAKEGDKVEPPETHVVATGFLVQDQFVLTNRHVIERIATERQSIGHFDNWYVRFTHPSTKGWSEPTRRIKGVFALFDPSGEGRLDAGIIKFNFNPNEDVSDIVPIEFGELESISVGRDIALCGFPFGNKWLVDEPGIRRFGAIVHQGMISAVSPYDTVDPREITSFLTDLNSAKGMSGSPVFSPVDGKVFGLHYAGEVGTLGCAIPVDEERVSGWITCYKQAIADPTSGPMVIGTLRITGGGDIEND